MKHLFTLILLFGALATSFACGNEYGHTLDGRKIHTRHFYLADRMLHFDTAAIESRIGELRVWVKNAPQDHRNWSDLAVNFLKIGKVDSAIKILVPLAIKYPREYNINANLGTAYELKGELDSALKYISRGYGINSKSHLGSEWVHIKILEAKIKNKKRPGWIKTNDIISQKELFSKLDTNRHYPAGRVNNELFYQIRTRAPFTPAPNEVLKNLLVSLGKFNTKHGTYENALMSYAYAMEFEKTPNGLRLIKNKIKDLNRIRSDQPNLKEIDDGFIGMMKRSMINPEIMVMGLDDFADKLDSIHLLEIDHLDSLDLLKTQLDSIVGIEEVEINPSENEGFLSKNKPYLFLFFGLIIGVIGALVFRKKRS